MIAQRVLDANGRLSSSFYAARWRNVAVAAGLLAFVGGAFQYTMHSVSKDDFSQFDEHGIKKVEFEADRKT